MPATKNILLIEDDEFIRESMKELLESESYHVDCAENGAEGLKFLKNAQELPGLILLDMMMPVMDGLQFRTEQLKDSRLSHLNVILMTADNRIDAATMHLTPDSYLKKPLDVEHVLSTLAKYF